MTPKLTLPRFKQLNYLMWHNLVNSKQTKHQRPQLRCYGGNEEEDDPLTPIKNNNTKPPPLKHPLPSYTYKHQTPLTHITPIKNNNTPFAKVICCKNLT